MEEVNRVQAELRKKAEASFWIHVHIWNGARIERASPKRPWNSRSRHHRSGLGLPPQKPMAPGTLLLGNGGAPRDIRLGTAGSWEQRAPGNLLVEQTFLRSGS